MLLQHKTKKNQTIKCHRKKKMNLKKREQDYNEKDEKNKRNTKKNKEEKEEED